MGTTSEERAVARLTQTHAVVIEGHVVEADSLIEQLRQARYSSIGSGGAGSPSDGSILNVKAVDLYEDIDGKVRGWLQHYRDPHHGELSEVILRLHERIQIEDREDRLEDGDRMLSMFAGEAHRIETLLDPPREKELTFPCPECGERYEITTSNEKRGGREVEVSTRRAAVRIPVKTGRALVAECHCCGKLWVSEAELMALAAAGRGATDIAVLAPE